MCYASERPKITQSLNVDTRPITPNHLKNMMINICSVDSFVNFTEEPKKTASYSSFKVFV